MTISLQSDEGPSDTHRPSPREQNGVDNRLRYLPPQAFPRDVIGAEVLACVNSAQSPFLRSR